MSFNGPTWCYENRPSLSFVGLQMKRPFRARYERAFSFGPGRRYAARMADVRARAGRLDTFFWTGAGAGTGSMLNRLGLRMSAM